MNWIVKDDKFTKSRIELNGSKYILGNGYIGYRGTLEEYSKEQLVACTISGLYDKVEGKWREPVNAPNGFGAKIYCDGELLSVLTCETEAHEQCLDIRNAVHKRQTAFITSKNKKITLNIERFLSSDNVHLMCMKCSFVCSEDCDVTIETGFDNSIWDINGPHLENFSVNTNKDISFIKAYTHELKVKVCEAEVISLNFGQREVCCGSDSILNRIVLTAEANKEYCFCKYISLFTSQDGLQDPEISAEGVCSNALEVGYDELFLKHRSVWENRWKASDVKIKGDEDAQFALRYSIYHLLAIAPAHSDKVSIPARGLSGQVYKGAVFWDTEMFMLPFFNFTNPNIARNIVMYRFHTLNGARRKAQEYGFRGAFYAWESQETGDDACTLFNITDIFTNRPMRTYFRDKQVHISADVAYGIWQYYKSTGDMSALLDGGAEVILECARFFYSYAYLKLDKNRYEILDVTGPDEYHERVNNNAFTNSMVKNTLQIALNVIDIMKKNHQKEFNELMSKLNYFDDINGIVSMLKLLYVPKPDENSHLIEQFDGYYKLEDLTLSELKARVLNSNEYLGGGNGLATTTQILKQADTVLMLSLFRDSYSFEVKKANWEFYERRTEHGSSLSSCVYAMVAANIGNPEWAYKYFMKTATIDLNGDSKQYVGTLYIGGTHPAANGGAWMASIFGFAGLSLGEDTISIWPHLPEKWEEIDFNFMYKGNRFNVEISKANIKIKSDRKIITAFKLNISGRNINCEAGSYIEVEYDR